MLLDEEVFAVILAVSVIASVVGLVYLLKPVETEPFIALGLLGKDCLIGGYPKTVINNTRVELCLFIGNYLGGPVYYQVRYKIASTPDQLPSNTTPSPLPTLSYWSGVLENNANTTFRVEVPVYTTSDSNTTALVFELWTRSKEGWVYTGRWVHLYVNVTSW